MFTNSRTNGWILVLIIIQGVMLAPTTICIGSTEYTITASSYLGGTSRNDSVRGCAILDSAAGIARRKE